MVAIVTGNGFGLQRSSAFVLGSNGQLGSASLGRAGENVAVNAATGNLVITNTDEMLFGLGLNETITRAYNSLTSYGDHDNNDKWQQGYARHVESYTGTLNSSGSTVTLIDWDGSDVTYSWNGTAYVAKEGSGAFDTLTWNNGTSRWTWTDGDSRKIEVFEASGGSYFGRIVSSADTDGNTLAFTYTSNLLTRVTTTTSASVQEYTDFTYSGSDLVSLVTSRHADAAGTASLTTLTRVTYGYDGSHRLTSVTVDLSPTDNSTSDGNKYVTTYTYDSTSNRVASITQTDGTSLAITYDGSNRVSTLVQTISTGVTRKTAFVYGTNTTDVRQYIDATNYYTTTLNYDASKQLTSIVQPAPVSGGSTLTTSFTYDSDGNVLTVTPPGGETVTYTYDSNGNRTLERDYAGNTVTRTFGSNNQVLTETHYIVPDPDGAGAGAPSSPMTTNYVYDSENHLRYVVTPQGRVTEYRYDAPGNLISVIQYTTATYASTYSETALNTWVSTTLTNTDRAAAKRSDTTYDFRGNINAVISYEKSTSAEAGDVSGSGQVSIMHYVYDQAGNLLNRYYVSGGTTTYSYDGSGNPTAAPTHSGGTTYTESYTFDGLNRLKTSSDFNGASTSIAYTDASGVTAVTLANGLVQTSTYDKAGELVSYAESGSGVTTATTSYRYDVLGRLRAVIDPTSLNTYFLYDHDGRKVADIVADGSIVEYQYNADSQLVATIAYKNNLGSGGISSLLSGSGDLAVVELSSVRPTSDATDRWSWNIYDAAGRLIETIDAQGAATVFAYDGDDRLLSTTQYANLIAAATVTGYKTTAPTSLVTPTADSANDRVTRNFYDNDGRLVGTLDAEGYLTKIVYDAAGQKIQTIAYATQVPSGDRAAGAFATLLTDVGTTSNDINNYFLYDNRGLLRATIDGEGDLTRYDYDLVQLPNVAPQLSGVTKGQVVSAATAYTLATLPAASGVTLDYTTYTHDVYGHLLTEVRHLAGSDTETDTYVYNSRYQVVSKTTTSTVNTDTRTVTNRYDLRGNLTGTVGGVGSATLPGSPTQTQIDTAIANYGTTYVYDTADRLISKTEADGVGGSGNKTLYSYDVNGRLRFQISPLGEVVEYRYNHFDDRTDTFVYAARIASTTLATLITEHATSGQITSTLTSAITAITNSSLDSRIQTAFNVTGTTSQVTDALGRATTYAYNAFGQLTAETDPIDSGTTVTKSFAFDRRGSLLSSTIDSASLNIVTAYAYDAFGRAKTVTDPTGVVTATAYDRASRTVSTTIDSGSGTLNLASSFTYDGRGNLLTSTDPTGAVTHYTANEFGRITTVATPLQYAASAKTTTVYNAYGQTLTVTDASGVAEAYTYDKDGHVLTDVVDPGTTGHQHLTTTYAYDNDGRAVSKTVTIDASTTAVTRYGYNADNQLIYVVDPVGNLTANTYDSAGRLISTRTYVNPLSGGTMTSLASTPNSVASIVATALPTAASNDQVTNYVYDQKGQLTFVLDGLGHAIGYTYNRSGWLLHTTSYAGFISPSAYTIAAINTALTAAGLDVSTANETTRFVYDKAGRQVYSISAANVVTQSVYDKDGRVLRQTQYTTATTTTGDQSSATWDTWASSHTSTTDRITCAVYDNAGRQTYSFTTAGYTAGNHTYIVKAFVYDADGRVTKATQYADVYSGTATPTQSALVTWATTSAYATNSANRISRTLYDADGQAVYGVDAEGYVTKQTYDLAGKVTASTRYAAAYTVTDSTTLSGLTTTIGSPTGSAVTSYAYDTAGRVTDVTDPEGSVTHLALDGAGRVTDRTVAYGTGDAVTTHYAYDAAGRVTSQTLDPSGLNIVTAYTYDGMGRVLTVTLGGVLRTTNTYDADGRVLTTTTALDASTNAVTTNQYDAFGNLVKVTDPRGNIGYFYYDALNRLYLQVDPEGYATKTDYSIGDQATKVTHYMTVTTGAAVGTPPTITTNSAIDEVTTITRDKLDRVIGTTDAEGYSETYTLNAFGDRVTVVNKLGGSTTNTFDKRGLLLTETLPISSVNSSGTTIASTVTNKYAYDARGNRTQMIEAYGLSEARTTNYAYDKADRQITVTHDAVTVMGTDLTTTVSVTPTETITYDARGNVIQTTKSDGQTSGVTAKTLFYYDHADRKIAEIDALGDYRSWTYDAANNALTARVYDSPLTSLPSTPGGSPPTAVNPTVYRETSFTYDRANRQVGTSVASLLTGAWNGTSYATTTGAVTTSTVYDAAGNVIQQTDGLGNSLYTFYDKAGHKVGQVDQEKYFTKWTLNGDGNVVSETRYATALIGTITAGTLPTAPSATSDDRTTTFTYDRNGRRLTETRTGVVAYSIDSSTGVLSTASTSAIVTYAYNGLGEVTRKTEATGDYIDYAYDVGGRQTSQTTSAFTDYAGASVQRRTSNYYDGLNNLTRSSVDSVAGTGAARVTQYTYGAGGRMATMVDAEGFTRTYAYDAAGRVVKEGFTRTKSDGTTVTQANAARYDLLGRATYQAAATYAASTWTAGDYTTLAYDTYGEVTAKGMNGLSQETYSYDTAGRMWRTTSGDGTVKLMVYDAAGNATMTVSSVGADISSVTLAGIGTYTGGTPATNTVQTITTFSKRGQANGTVEQGRQLSSTTTATITRSKTYNAFGEVASETDGRSDTTNYSYNTLGKLIQKQSPGVSITAENGTITTGYTPIENYYFDLSGRLIGVRDANNYSSSGPLVGGITTRLLAVETGYGGDSPTVLKEFHPDGGVSVVGIDVFGDQRKYTNEIGNVELRDYDKMGRLLTLTRPTRVATSTTLVEHYTYDGLGERLTHWNSQFGSSVKETTDYDAQGRVVSQIDYMGYATTTSYVWDATGVLSAAGGWVKTVTTPAIIAGTSTHRTLIDKQTYFGRVVAHTDEGGNTYSYGFDNAGRMTTQTNSAGQNLTYSYYNTGRLSGVSDATGDLAQFSYTYDVDGNRLTEKYTATVSGVATTYENATVTYDALNRMLTFVDTAGAAAPSIVWEYDANGNVRRNFTTFTNTIVGSVTQTQDYWYKYDSMNRFVLTKGAFSGTRGSGSIVATGGAYNGGLEISYNAAGQRVSVLSHSSTTVQDGWHWEEVGDGQYEKVYDYVTYPSDHREDYTYTEDGYLATVRIADTPYNYTTHSAGTIPSTGTLRAQDDRDALGRISTHTEYQTDGTTVAYSRYAVYNNDSQVTYDTTTTRSTNSAGTGTDLVNATTNYYFGAETYAGSGVWTGAYQGGQVTYSYTSNTFNGSTTYADTVNSYVWWDDARQSLISYRANISTGTTTTSTFTYDVNSHLSSVAMTGGYAHALHYVTDVGGQILQRYTTSASGSNPFEFYYNFNGMRLGDTGTDGYPINDYDYVNVINEHIRYHAPPTNSYTYGAAVSYADFEQSFSPVNAAGGQGEASTASSVTVRDGDTLQSIARTAWGDASLWYLIADANGLSGSDALIAGMTLTLPAKVTNVHNNSSTFRVYDPNDAMGDIQPGQPAPPKPKKGACGGVGMILVAIIAVVVAAIVAPYATVWVSNTFFGTSLSVGAGLSITGGTAGLAATVAGGAVAGAAGSIVSQAVGVATGIQDKFSWKGVALAAIGGAVGGAVGKIGPLQSVAGKGNLLTNIVRGAERGVLSNALTQGVAVATGLQSKFDWAGVAVGGVVGGVTAAVSYGLDPNSKIDPTVLKQGGGVAVGQVQQTVNEGVSGMAGAIAGAATRTALSGGDFGDNLIAVLPDVIATTVGNSIFRELQASAVQKERVLDGMGADFKARHPDADEDQIAAARQQDSELYDTSQILQRKQGIFESDAHYKQRIADANVRMSNLRDRRVRLAIEADHKDYTPSQISDAMAAARPGYNPEDHPIQTVDVDANSQTSTDITGSEPGTAAGVVVWGKAVVEEMPTDDGLPAAIGARPVDKAIGIAGDKFVRIGKAIGERPWLKYGLEGAGYIADGVALAYGGPVRFVIAQALNAGQGALANKGGELVADRFASVGYDPATSAMAGIGGEGIIQLALSSHEIVKMAKALPGLLENLTKRLSRGAGVASSVDVLAGRKPGAETGGWEEMRIRPTTEETFPGTQIPRSFEIDAGNGAFWIHGNAAEHFADDARGMARRGLSPDQIALNTQTQMRSLQGALASATKNGISYDKMIRVDGWELMIGRPKAAGQLPVVYHARYLGN